jgi:hypothetical protein
VRERADGSAVIEDASGKQIGPVYGSADQAEIALTKSAAGEVPNPTSTRPIQTHKPVDEIAENLGLPLLKKHGDPSKWKHLYTKSEPLTQRGARAGEKKVYEVWEDEFGKKFEWHYEVNEFGVATTGKYVFPSTTAKPR